MIWAGPAIPVLFLAIMGYQRRWVAEDAFISLRVVEQILAGNGPVFNQGERVEAYTHPLWVAILAVWGALGLPTPLGSVILGLVFSISGLIAALAAASMLSNRITLSQQPACRPEPQRRTSPLQANERSRQGRSFAAAQDDRRVGELSVPVGALIFVALPVVWDFVTSGLETGLAFAWLGLSFWLLVRSCFDEERAALLSRATIGSAVVIGVGPLVRPDLGVFSAGFLVGLIVCSHELSRTSLLRHALILGTAAASFPLAYQIFRMGYFATLVPNTALAKEASVAHWSQGWIYFQDFTGTYHLWLPLLVATGCWFLLARQAWGNADRQATIVLSVPVAAALLHAVYVVRVGGDFMHGRFLLPTLFGLLLPVMLVRVPVILPRAQSTVAATIVIVAWSVVAALWLRVPYPAQINDDGLADERSVYVENSGHPNPITLDDYMQMTQPWPRDGQAWHDLATDHPRVLVIDMDQYPLNPAVDPDIAVVALAWNVGLAGYAAGIEVHVADRLGLSDPIASRLRIEERGRPGHEKELSSAWVIARFSTARGSVENVGAVAAARSALECGEVDDLLDAVSQPMTLGRFADNLVLAFSLHDLRLPNDSVMADDELCQ